MQPKEKRYRSNNATGKTGDLTFEKMMQPKQAGWFDFVGGNETIQQTNGTKHDFWLQDLLLCAHKTLFVHRTGTKKG